MASIRLKRRAKRLKKMKNSDRMKKFQNAYDDTYSLYCSNFNGSDLQSETFGRILNAFSLHPEGQTRAFYLMSLKNKGGSWATFICPCMPGGEIPDNSLREENCPNTITVLLHWGMNYEFLDDMSSWGHKVCPYKTEEVNFNVIDFFRNEEASNYWDLYDAINRFKKTGEWLVAETE